jgi:hypothetical protein
MRPLFEKVTVPEGASWALLDRKLDDDIPSSGTTTLNSS